MRQTPRALAALTASVLLLAGCSASGSGDGASEPGSGASAGADGAGGSADPDADGPPSASLVEDADAVGVVGGEDAAARSVQASEALFASAPVVVLTGPDDVDAAAESAAAVGAPVLAVPVDDAASDVATDAPGGDASGDPAGGDESTAADESAAADETSALVSAEVERLGAATVLAVGDDAGTWVESADLAAEVLTDPAELPEVGEIPQVDGTMVLAWGDAANDAALATAQAVGAEVLTMGSPDPRRDPETIEALAAAEPDRVVGLGVGAEDRFVQRVAVARTGVEIPGGGQVAFPGRHMVALYGSPGTSSLGVLGEQDVDAAIARAEEVAAEYDGLFDDPVVPTFEIITTVASSEPGADGDYSNEIDPAVIEPWVDAAEEAGVYVVLDLQPGRTDFLTQAQIYEDLLARPHVGLALDPEWRLEPDQQHLAQIGSVTAAEVNEVGAWLADLTAANDLPQKVFLLHQFRTSMITDRDTVDTSRDELAVLVHADGNGDPGSKLATYDALRAGAEDDFWWGWKNFYDEDSPTFTPEETAALEPQPVFISYQ